MQEIRLWVFLSAIKLQDPGNIFRKSKTLRWIHKVGKARAAFLADSEWRKCISVCRNSNVIFSLNCLTQYKGSSLQCHLDTYSSHDVPETFLILNLRLFFLYLFWRTIEQIYFPRRYKNFNSHIEVVELNSKVPHFWNFISIVVVGNLKKLEK